MRKSIYVILAVAVIVALVAAPQFAAAQAKKAEHKAKAPAAEKSLYDRLGKKKAITAVVKDFLANVLADAKIKSFFAHADAKKLEKNLIDQICQATGGPCKYTGKDMKTAHKGMGVSTADFNALVGDLVKALDKNKVPEKEKNELLGALGGMKGDIVEKP